MSAPAKRPSIKSLIWSIRSGATRSPSTTSLPIPYCSTAPSWSPARALACAAHQSGSYKFCSYWRFIDKRYKPISSIMALGDEDHSLIFHPSSFNQPWCLEGPSRQSSRLGWRIACSYARPALLSLAEHLLGASQSIYPYRFVTGVFIAKKRASNHRCYQQYDQAQQPAV